MQSLAIDDIYFHDVNPIRAIIILSESIDDKYPWCFFDGAALGDQSVDGAGGVIYHYAYRCTCIEASVGHAQTTWPSS